jgi:hypothetical protein
MEYAFQAEEEENIDFDDDSDHKTLREGYFHRYFSPEQRIEREKASTSLPSLPTHKTQLQYNHAAVASVVHSNHKERTESTSGGSGLSLNPE